MPDECCYGHDSHFQCLCLVLATSTLALLDRHHSRGLVDVEVVDGISRQLVDHWSRGNIRIHGNDTRTAAIIELVGGGGGDISLLYSM